MESWKAKTQTKGTPARALVAVAALLCANAPRLSYAASGVGVLFGEVVDVAKGNKPVPDAIIVVTSPNMQGEQTAISDEKGLYRIDQLPPGDYSIKASAPGFKEYEISGVKLMISREVKVRISMVPEVIEGKEITVTEIISTIDQGSTSTGLTVTKDYMEKVTTKRSMEAVTEATPGAQQDDYGISFAGTTSPENNFVVDGLNTTNTSYGTNGVQLPVEFFDQIAVNVGGYLPEFGNATGGVVTAVTKSGGNEFHGSVFSYSTPLRLAPREVERFGETIVGSTGLDLQQQLGFEIGGPIVKDYLWFHVGFAPTWTNTWTQKRFRRLADRNGDGIPDLDARDNPVMEDLQGSRIRYGRLDQVYAWTAKLTFNPSDKHRLTVGAMGNPTFGRGSNQVVRGDKSASLEAAQGGDYSVRLNYDGKLADNKLLLNATVGYTIALGEDLIYNQSTNSQRIQWALDKDITAFEPNLASFCTPLVDAEGNVTPRCIVSNYSTGGQGFLDNTRNERVLGNASISYLAKFLGTHQLKAGVELQHARTTARTQYTGGAAIRVVEGADGGEVYEDYRRYGRLRNVMGEPTEDNIDYLQSWTNTVYFNNYAAYAQDSWSIMDRINLNGGLRFDFQDLYGKAFLPTDNTRMVDQRAMALANFSPRVGLIWDFLGNGRTKLFGSYGRFYQLVPLNSLVRSQPGEQTVRVEREKCSAERPTDCPAVGEYQVGGGEPTHIARDITGQYIDQVQFGGEYQVLNDLLIGLNYQHSQYGDVIEDVALDDNGNQYFIGNPGLPASRACAAQQAADPTVPCNSEAADTFDPLTRQTVKIKFPKPERRYDAVNVYVTKSLARNFIIQASYTLSFLRGNFSGLYRPESGQLNPNINSDFDLATLLPNRYGYLAADRRHQVKIDGAYIFDISERFSITPNISFRLASGTPYSYTGAHPIYGSNEAYILTRGIAGTTEPLLQFDGGLKAEYRFSKDTKLIVGVTVINIGSLRMVRGVDERFTVDSSSMRPIKGGSDGSDDPRRSDLVFVKDIRNNPAGLNPNFANATQYQRPMELRVDVKLSF